MKRKTLLLLLMLALGAPWAVWADDLTVHDNTSTNSYVPVYGYYADAYLKCEMVYPASELSSMTGGEISSLTFYASQSSVSWGNANFQVFVAEVSSASISSFNGPGTVVYQGALSISNGEMNVTFTTPYQYNGGNLLIGFYNTVTGSYVTSSWYGETVNNASVQGYSYSSLSAVSATQRNFLPKTTFTYTIPSCTPTWTGTGNYYIANFKAKVDGESTYQIDNTTTGTKESTSDYYGTHSISAEAGSTILYNTTPNTNSTWRYALWVDWNHDGDFADTNEEIYNSNSYITISEKSFSIPSGTTAGNYRMRVMIDYYGTGSYLTPCGSNKEGEAEDYKLTVTPPTSCTITASADSSVGSVSGGGTINYGTSCTVSATANNCYSFVNWTENGAVVSSSASYTFTATSNRNLEANFTVSSPSISANPTAFVSGQSVTLSSNCAPTNFFAADPYIWDWESSSYTGNNHITSASVQGSMLKFTTTGNDPMINMYSIGSFDPTIYKTFRMRYRIISGTGGNVEVFFVSTTGSNTSGATTGYSRSTSLTSDGNWHIAEINMSGHSNWVSNGNVTGWRLDPCNYPDVTMIIDWIGLFPDAIAQNVTSTTHSPSVTTTYTACFYSAGALKAPKAQTTVTAAPANSLCSTATSLPCGTSSLAGTTVNTPGLAHGISGASLSDYGVWYTFTGDGRETTISSTATFDHEMVICTGTCGSSLTQLYGDDSAVSGSAETRTFTTTNGTVYYVYIAYCGSGNTTGTFTISRSCCSAPTNFSLVLGNDGQSVILSWNGSASGYDVAHATSSSADPASNIVNTFPTTSCSMTDLVIDEDHYFWVRSNCGGEQSGWVGPLMQHVGYCTPAPSSVDNNGVTRITFTGSAALTNTTHPTSAPFYGNYTSQVIQAEIGQQVSVAVTYATSYTYNTYVWVDYNKNLVFDSDEVVCYGESTSSNPTTLSLSFTVPATVAPGDYRLRFGGADSGLGSNPANANPCYTGTWGIFEDYTLSVSCVAPTNLTASNVLSDEATLSWTGTGSIYDVYLGVPNTDTIISEDFEGVTGTAYNAEGNMPSGWFSYTTNTGTYIVQPHVTSGSSYNYHNSGSQSVNLESGSYASNNIAYVVLPANTSGNYESLSFYYRQESTSSGYGTLQVGYVTAQTSTACGSFTSIQSITASSTLHQETVDISSVPSNAYIAFKWQVTGSSASYYACCIDDVTVTAVTSVDWNLVSSNESNSYTLSNLASATTYYATILSACDDQSNVVSFTTLTCENPTNVAAGSITNNSAAITWSSNVGNYDVRYRPYYFEEDFEGGSLPTGWTIIDNDNDGSNWYWAQTASDYTHSGNGLMTSASTVQSGGAYVPLTPDNWLVTPQIELRGTMKVYLRAQDPDWPAEHFAIYLSTTGNSVSNFTSGTVLVSDTQATGNYVEYTADLSSYNGQMGYIAIRHFNCSDQFRLNVDDFGLYANWQTTTASSNSINLSNLEADTEYEVQVRSNCGSNTGHSQWVSTSFTTLKEYTVAASVLPANSGSITGTGFSNGSGTYAEGSNVTLTASAQTGYTFQNWTEGGSVVGQNASYTINPLQANHTLVANFQLNSYQIAVSPNPNNGGTVTGAGTYNHGTSCTVTATPATNYRFVNWTEGGSEVSTSATYSFTVTGARTLVANFVLDAFQVNVTVAPSGVGTVSGGGAITVGADCTLTPTVTNNNYVFAYWEDTYNGSTVYSTNNSYTIYDVQEPHNVVAHFAPINISNTTQWDEFCDAVNHNFTYQGLTVNMTTNVGTVTTMAGVTNGEETPYNNYYSNSDYAFRGTFNGNGNTLTVNLTNGTTSENFYYCAPFRKTYGATIQNLKVAGTITTAKQGAGGIAGLVVGTSFTNCSSQATITNNYSGGDATSGGLAAVVRAGTNSFTGCAFTGTLASSNSASNWGGFVGWRDSGTGATVAITNCVFDPTSTSTIGTSSCSNFCRPSASSITNSYYDGALGSSTQGKQMYTITRGSGVSAMTMTGTGTTYNASSIIAYSGNQGLFFNNNYIAGDSDQVSLTLSSNLTVSQGSHIEYSATGNATLNPNTGTGNNDAVTLTMSSAATVISATTAVNTHNITIASTNHGSVTTSPSGSANFNANVTITTTPDTGYQVDQITVTQDSNNNTVTVSNGSFTMPDDDVTVTVTFRPITYTITYNLDGGTVATANPASYTIETATFTLNNPTKTGNTFAGWTGTGLSGATDPVTIAQGSTGNRSYTATWTVNNYNISYTDDGNGTCSGPATANYGTTVNVTVTPDTGYELASLTYNGTTITPVGGVYSFSMPASAVTVHATFRKIDYAITYTNDGNGTCSGPATANYGDNVSVTVTPATGYELASLTYTPAGGSAVDITSAMQFSMPASAVTVHATFTKIDYTITYVPSQANPSNGCYISGAATANLGDPVTVSVTEGTGYHLVSMSYNDGSDHTITPVNNVYSFTMPASAVTVTATFAINTYTITVNANPSAYGSVSGGGTYNYGASCTVEATANAGYAFDNWTENNSVVSGAGATYTFTVTSSRTLTANFIVSPPTVTLDTVVPNTPTTANAVGSYAANGNAVSSPGFCWSTSHNPTVGTSGTYYNSNQITVNGTTFSGATTTNLSPNTRYYMRAFVMVGATYYYSAEREFYSLVDVTTTAATNVYTIDATLNGSYATGGDGTVSGLGFVYDTISGPTIGGHGTQVALQSPYNTPFSANVTGLKGNKTYYVKAYATNDGGTSYGTEVTFRTLPYYAVVTNVDPADGGTVTYNPRGDGNGSLTQVDTIGTGNTYQKFFPFVSTKAYSFCEMLYEKTSGMVAGNITHISFHFKSSNGALNHNIVLYMKEVNDTDLSNGCITVSAADQRYSGTLVAQNDDGWVTIALQPQFRYNGTGNLLVAVDYNNVNSPVTTGTRNWYSTTTGNNITTYGYYNSNSVDVDPYNPSGDVTSGSSRPDIILQFLTAGGHAEWYHYGASTTLTATANRGYEFVNWTENGNQVSTDTCYLVSNITANRTLKANFRLAYLRFINDGNWNVAGNWSPQRVPTINDKVAIEAAATIPNGYRAEVDSIYPITHQNSSITIADGGQLWHNSLGAVASIERNVTGYGATNDTTNLYYILYTSPVTGNLSAFHNFFPNGNQPTDHSDLYYFDYNHYVNGDLLEWVRVDSAAIHTMPYAPSGMNGYITGYIYARETNTTLVTPNGTIRPSDAAYDIPLRYTTGGTERFNGWNLIGNPFVCDAYVTAYNGNATTNLNYYVLDAQTGSEFILGNSNMVRPTGAIMVQATASGQSVRCTRTAPSNPNPSGILNIDVMSAYRDGGMLDRARLRFGDGVGLAKFQLNPNHTKVYIPRDGTDYAVVYVEPMGVIPVNFMAERSGRYTITVSEEAVHFSYLHLIDNKTGVDTDLLRSPSYTFEAKPTDYESRFKIVFVADDEEVTESEGGNFAFYTNGTWIIDNDGDAILQLVDVTGRILGSERISGSCAKAYQVAPGVYMLRLVKGKEVRTQKIVVMR